MIKFSYLAIIAIACSALHAQSETAAAKARLDAAVKEMEISGAEFADLRRSLYREINKLDDEAIALQKELRSLEFAETQRTANLRKTETALANRKTEFDYSAGILRQYAKTLPTRLHPAENQKYLSALEMAERAAASHLDDSDAELKELLKAATIGMDRLRASALGSRFEGKALRNGTEALNGNFAVYGPAVYFSSQDGKFQGMSPAAQSGAEYPNVVSLQGVDNLATAEAIKSGTGALPIDGTMGKALEVQANEDTMMDTIKKGGLVGHCILGLGVISLIITIFKFFQIKNFHIPSRRSINDILDSLVSNRNEDAASIAQKIPGMSGDLVRTGVKHFFDKRKVLEEALFEKLMGIKPKLDSMLPFLGLTAAVAPLMGLLGTVLGIIKTFQSMVLYGTGNAKNFSAGISEALITTAEGLIVAIPVLVLHGLMKAMAKGKSGDAEGIAISLINGTSEVEKKKAKTPSQKIMPPGNNNDDDEEEDDDFEINSPKPTPA